jgi:DNA polymerase-3 subunit beta
VSVVVDGQNLRMAATNGYRLGVASNRIAAPTTPQAVIVPATSLHELSQALETVEGQQAATVKVYHNRIQVDTDGVCVIAQTIDGHFPDYQAIVPRSFDTSVTVDTKAFVRSLQVARILTRQDKDGTERVELAVDPATKRMAISASKDEVGDSGDALDVEVTGKATTITLSIGYMLDVLTRIDGDTVKLLLNGDRKPCIIQLPNVPADDFNQVIMPIHTK